MCNTAPLSLSLSLCLCLSPSVQDGLASDFTVLTKELYDLQKAQESDTTAGSPLKELVIEQFDEEQIWQEIELQNHSVLNYFKDTVAFLLQDPFSRLIDTRDVEIEAPEEDFENNECAETEDEIVEGCDGEEEVLKKQAIKRKPLQTEKPSDEDSDEDSDLNFDIAEVEERTKLQRQCPRFASSSELDDKFFRLSEMEDFLEKVEKEEKKQKENDEIDYFEDIPSEDEELGDYFKDVPSEDDEVVLKTKTKIKVIIFPQYSALLRDASAVPLLRGRGASAPWPRCLCSVAPVPL
ncbi:hypothetical protein scyTo_0026572, partial [Scyliorhinus torazame]|nr:hypothetical protein [Scyliorhinus torazame]